MKDPKKKSLVERNAREGRWLIAVTIAIWLVFYWGVEWWMKGLS